MEKTKKANDALAALVVHYNTPKQLGDRKSGLQQIQDNASSILADCTIDRTDSRNIGRTLLKQECCKISTLSLDGRGRAQRAMRLRKTKRNFRPWHITWIAKYGPPLEFEKLEYIHRCHNENCCEPKHGYWGTSQQNKATNDCRTASHIITISDDGDKKVVKLCPHLPCCLRPVVVREEEFEKIN